MAMPGYLKEFYGRWTFYGRGGDFRARPIQNIPEQWVEI